MAAVWGSRKGTVPLVIRSYHNLTRGMTMAHYKIIMDKEDLRQPFNQDQGMARLVENVLNNVLEAVDYDNFRALFAVS